MSRSAVAVAALLSLAACGSPGQRPPFTRVDEVRDTLHGVEVEDPYRWLEHQQDTVVRQWIDAQWRYADGILGDSSAHRDTLRARLTALLDVPAAGAPRRGGTWEYFTLRRVGELTGSIYRRPAPKDPERIVPENDYEKVVDALAIRADGTTGVAVEGVSSDGKVLMYSVRDGGPDEIAIRFLNTETKQDLQDSLPTALYASLNLTPDGNGVYFVHRSRTDGPRYRFHRIGTPAAQDSMLFGADLRPTAFINVTNAAALQRRVYTVGHGWARNQVFLQDTRSGAVTELTQGLDAHFTPQIVNNQLWLRTDHRAPRGRLVRVDLTRPAADAWVTVVPEGEDVLDGFTTIGDRLFVTWVHNVSSRITIHTLDGKQTGEIPLAPHSTATIRGHGAGKAMLTTVSFSQPSASWVYDVATGARTAWEPPEVPFDSAGLEVRQVWYTSKDGTRAPMYLVHRRGLARSATTPTLLHGYGGFAVSLMPRFDARAALWVERGGIYAQATLRGGNEFGEEWHKGGMLGNKQRVFDDFLSAAQFLVDSGYTSASHLAIRGVSNGGLLMGAALTQRPDLFGAAFVGLPDLDILRFPAFTTHNNMPALLEYGDATEAAAFPVIRAFSPYQNIKRAAYPAVMVQTGINDTRVPPWQARKFAARLQRETTSGKPVVFYHDMRSGHAGGRSIVHTIDQATREMEFLLRYTR